MAAGPSTAPQVAEKRVFQQPAGLRTTVRLAIVLAICLLPPLVLAAWQAV